MKKDRDTVFITTFILGFLVTILSAALTETSLKVVCVVVSVLLYAVAVIYSGATMSGTPIANAMIKNGAEFKMTFESVQGEMDKKNRLHVHYLHKLISKESEYEIYFWRTNKQYPEGVYRWNADNSIPELIT